LAAVYWTWTRPDVAQFNRKGAFLFRTSLTSEQQLLLVECIPHLRAYARSLNRHPESADDLVQDCLSRAVEKMHQWQPGSNMRAWLFSIMHNMHVDRIKRDVNGPTFVSSDEYSAVLSAVSSGANPEIAPMMDDLERALDGLAPEQREVIHLVCMEELKYVDVAHILQVPVGTVMSRLSRAREQLRAMMFDNKPNNLRRVK